MRESGASVVGKQVLGPERNDSDATITGFVLQQHLPSLLIFLSYKIPSMRFAALGLIGTLLRQGKLILSFLFYLFYFILFYFILFYFILFHFILSHFIYIFIFTLIIIIFYSNFNSFHFVVILFYFKLVFRFEV